MTRVKGVVLDVNREIHMFNKVDQWQEVTEYKCKSVRWSEYQHGYWSRQQARIRSD